MKQFTLIEADKYIRIDSTGIFFTEDNWPFADIEHLWAIQWKDNGTEDGTGEVEYDSPVPNTPATRAMIERYVDHFNKEKDRQEEEQRKAEEAARAESLSWQEAMAELEGQMEEMQKRHDSNLRAVASDHDSQMAKLEQEHFKQMDEMSGIERKIISQSQEDIHRTHERIAQAHEEFFYGEEKIQDNISESEKNFQFEAGYENLTVFDGNVDPSLFDDAVDDSFFEVEEAEIVKPEDIDTDDVLDQIDGGVISDQIIGIDEQIGDIDMDVLDSEFSLELLFEEDSTEQVVNDIEKMISEDDSDTPDAEIPDNEPTTD
tara:strand:- start:14725 stop:15675 length:951 start_codon:yes stop_codon:yes gene_type:complete